MLDSIVIEVNYNHTENSELLIHKISLLRPLPFHYLIHVHNDSPKIRISFCIDFQNFETDLQHAPIRRNIVYSSLDPLQQSFSEQVTHPSSFCICLAFLNASRISLRVILKFPKQIVSHSTEYLIRHLSCVRKLKPSNARIASHT